MDMDPTRVWPSIEFSFPSIQGGDRQQGDLDLLVW